MPTMVIYWVEAYTLKGFAEVLVAATREIRLQVCADKSKCIVMSRDQNEGHN